MKFQITIKEQSEAVNGKVKYPLYKAANQKTFDEDRGLQTLDQLLQTSSIKIFCNQCQKQITLQTIVISHDGQQKIQPEKQQTDQVTKQKSQNEDKPKATQKQKYKNKVQSANQSKIKLDKPKPKNKLDDDIFEQKGSSDSSVHDQMHSDSQNQSQAELQQKVQRFQNRPQSKEQPEQSSTAQITREITHLYCVGCFACLEEFPKFYSIRKSLEFSPLNSEWSAYDEVNLVNGLKFWGFGNWGQIKDFMDYNSSLFTVNQIQSHYEELYLKVEGPTFPNPNEFDITKAQKPPKKLLEDIMHHYYFPLQSQQNLKSDPHSNKQGPNFKKEKHPETVFTDKIESFYRESQRHPTVGLSSKHLRANNFLLDTIHPSNTSLYHLNDANQKQNQDKAPNDEQSDSEFQEDSDLSDNEVPFNQIQLKPKSSSHIQEGRMNGKGIKQGLSRSPHIFPDQINKSNEAQISSPFGQQIMTYPNSKKKLKGHNVYSYNPKRKQFQIIEYDYYAESMAESMLASLEFSQEDTEQQIQLKIKIIQQYNKRLDERVKRRQFVIQHRLLDTDFMIKTLHRYNKANFQVFQPFRRLLPKNEDYYQILDSYEKKSKASSLAQGVIKLKRKLRQTHKNPQTQHFIEYLNQKKEKKELLGKRARFQSEAQRRVLSKEGPKTTKKTIISMGENSHSYVNNQSALQQPLSPSNHLVTQIGRTMISRSEERQRLRSNNQQNLNREGQNFGNQEIINENINFGNIGTLNNSNGIINGCSTRLNTIVSQEDINAIERYLKNQMATNKNFPHDFKPLSIKNFALKPLTSKHKFKN